MPSYTAISALALEIFSKRSARRKTEPDLVMDDPEKVAAFTRAGRVDGVMAPMYLFHCAQISEVIRPGDTVLDLGCGPATQLSLVASINPQSNFIGVDLSSEMLAKATNYMEEQAIDNIELRQENITKLASFPDQSIDAVMSTVVLHHLPDVDALQNVFAEVARVLKPGGGIYIVDFGHLKSERSIQKFAYQYANRQPELFTLDYLYSLQAAFWLEDFKSAHKRHLKAYSNIYSTFIAPFLVAIKSPARHPYDLGLANRIKELKQALPSHHKTDIKDLKTFFSLGKLKTPYL